MKIQCYKINQALFYGLGSSALSPMTSSLLSASGTSQFVPFLPYDTLCSYDTSFIQILFIVCLQRACFLVFKNLKV